MTETVTVWRPAASTDVYGNTRRGNLQQVGSFTADVEQTTRERHDSGGDGTETVVVCYAAGQTTGVLGTDVVEVRGSRYPVDGDAVLWRWPDGGIAGEVVTARKVVG